MVGTSWIRRNQDSITITVEHAVEAMKMSLLSTKSIVISKTEKIKFEIDAIVLRKWGTHQKDSAQQDKSNGMLVV